MRIKESGLDSEFNLNFTCDCRIPMFTALNL